MKKLFKNFACILWIALILFPFSLKSQSDSLSLQSAETVVDKLYELVTVEAGTTPDWDQVRSLFLPEAIIVLRTSREGNTIFSLEGFGRWWIVSVTNELPMESRPIPESLRKK